MADIAYNKSNFTFIELFLLSVFGRYFCCRMRKKRRIPGSKVSIVYDYLTKSQGCKTKNSFKFHQFVRYQSKRKEKSEERRDAAIIAPNLELVELLLIELYPTLRTRTESRKERKTDANYGHNQNLILALKE